MFTTIVLGGIILGFAAFVIINQVKKARNGEGGCGCGCSGCSSVSACHGTKVKKVN